MAETAIVSIEREILGHGRTQDTRFLLGERPAWLARRRGRVVGVAFGCPGDVSRPKSAAPSRRENEAVAGEDCGPIGAVDPADLRALMATVENDAAARGVEALGYTIPLVNSTAVGQALGRHFRIDPFYLAILSSDDRMRLDRWIVTRPNYIL